MLSRRTKITTNNIDTRTKDTVFGFIHDHEYKFRTNHLQIPTVIGYMCLVYYHIDEKFTYHDSNRTLISSSNNIQDDQNDTATSTYHRGNIYGTIIVNFKRFVSGSNIKSTSTSYKSSMTMTHSGLHHVCFQWRFQVKSNGNIGIGLHSLSNKYPFISYGWTSSGIEFLSIKGHQMYTGHDYNKDDIITMRLFLNQSTLKFYRNNNQENPSVVIRNIDKNHDYKLAILMLDRQSCIKILDFQISCKR